MWVTGRSLVLAVVGGAVLWNGCRRAETRPEHIQSFAQIPAPRPELYMHVQDYAQWKNPFLTVLPDGIRIQCLPLTFEKKVQVGALRETLLSLPVPAWPYGSIVAVQAGSGPQNDITPALIEKNRVQVESILKASGVTIDYWP
jgi:hypothetical protein